MAGTVSRPPSFRQDPPFPSAISQQPRRRCLLTTPGSPADLPANPRTGQRADHFAGASPGPDGRRRQREQLRATTVTRGRPRCDARACRFNCSDCRPVGFTLDPLLFESSARTDQQIERDQRGSRYRQTHRAMPRIDRPLHSIDRGRISRKRAKFARVDNPASIAARRESCLSTRQLARAHNLCLHTCIYIYIYIYIYCQPGQRASSRTAAAIVTTGARATMSAEERERERV